MWLHFLFYYLMYCSRCVKLQILANCAVKMFRNSILTSMSGCRVVNSQFKQYLALLSSKSCHSLFWKVTDISDGVGWKYWVEVSARSCLHISTRRDTPRHSSGPEEALPSSETSVTPFRDLHPVFSSYPVLHTDLSFTLFS